MNFSLLFHLTTWYYMAYIVSNIAFIKDKCTKQQFIHLLTAAFKD